MSQTLDVKQWKIRLSQAPVEKPKNADTSVEHSQLPAENPEGGNTGSYRNRVKNIYIPLPFFVAASYLLVCYVVNRIHTEIILQR